MDSPIVTRLTYHESALLREGPSPGHRPIRKKKDLRPGDQLEVRVEGDRIMLIRRRIRLKKSRIVNDPITGLPVLSTAPGAPILTSAEVEEILAKI